MLVHSLFYSSTLFFFVNARLFSRADVNSCLTGLNVTYPGDPAFQSESQAFNARLSYIPAAIVLPSSVQDVEKLVSCGASLNVSVVARSGGHSYAAYGLGGQNGSLVADLSQLKDITLNGDDTVVVQTGNRLGELASYLWNNGQRALPHGTCPKVGTGGHTSYGGYGPYSRMAGLLMDRVVGAQVVLANGTTVTASNTTNSNLFWALKGAAPSFGIVTSWTYSTLSAPPTTVFFTINLPRYTTSDSFTSAFTAYQSFARNAPKEIAMAFSFGANNGGLGVQLLGNYFGSKADFTALVNPLVQQLGASIGTADEYTDWTKVLVANAYGEALVTAGPSPPNTFFAKSLVTTDNLDDASVKRWADYLINTAARADINWFIQADLYGGAISSDYTADSSSFAHRNAFLVIQFYGSSTNNAPYPSDGIDIVNGMVTSLQSNPSAAYPNYIDPTLSPDQWQAQYFDGNMQRLSGIKALYDPNNVFNFPQSIPVGDRSNVNASSSGPSPTGTNGSSTPNSAPRRGAGMVSFLFTSLALVLISDSCVF